MWIKQSKVLEIAAELLRNTMGKVQKNVLRYAYARVFG
jgi:hypothetical protein